MPDRFLISMSLRTLLLIAMALLPFPGCGSIHNLAPSTAAGRISSYDSYKEQACAVMQDYVSVFTAMSWETPGPVELKPQAEVEHFTLVFEHNPEVSCRIKAGKNIFDLTGRKFHQLLLQLGPLQKIYAARLEGIDLSCQDCALPDYPISNSFLAEYYRQAPFPAFRSQHMERFQDACLTVDQMGEKESEIRAHGEHVWPPSNMNPLYPSHSGCPEVWKSALQAQSSRCARYVDAPQYLVCPDVIWDTRSTPAIPLGYPKRYTRNQPFAAGFVLTVAEGYDVYWQTSPGVLARELIRVPAGTPAKFEDVDANGRIDFHAGGILFLAQRDRTAIRKVVVEYNREIQQADSDTKAQQAAMLEDRWYERKSLLELEEMLATSHINNALLLKRASTISEAWWHDTGEVSKSLREKTRIYWHAALWSKANRTPPIDAEFLSEALAALRTDAMELRLQTISQAYARGARGTITAECELLQSEIKHGTRTAEGIAEGTDIAEQEMGHVWRQYLKSALPSEKIHTSKAEFEAAVARMTPEIKTLCKRD